MSLKHKTIYSYSEVGADITQARLTQTLTESVRIHHVLILTAYCQRRSSNLIRLANPLFALRLFGVQ